MGGVCVAASVPNAFMRPLPSGGCSVAASGAGASGAGVWLALLALGALLSRRRLRLALLAVAAGCGPGGSGLEIDLHVDDNIIVLAHHARIIASSADKSVTFPATMSGQVKTGLTLANYDADGDGQVDIVLELGPTYEMERTNKFRFTPDGTAKIGFSVKVEIYDGLGNAFARAPAVQAMLQPGTNTQAAEIDPKCLNSACSDGTHHLAAGDAQTITFAGAQPTALAALGSVLAAGAAHEPNTANNKMLPNAGLVQVWTTLAGSPITMTGGEAGDLLGTALAVGDVDGDGKTDLIVGAPGTDSDKGAAYLYLGPDFATGKKLAGVTAGDRVGAALAVVGNQVVVGADGAAKVYLAKATDFGADVSALPAIAGAAGSRFGAAIAVDGNNVAIGAPAANAAFQKMVSDFSGASGTAGTATVTGSGGFGSAVALAHQNGATTLVVGAPGLNRVQSGSQAISGPSAMSGFGGSLAVLPFGDGDVIVAGAADTLNATPGAGGAFAVRPATMALSSVLQLGADGTPAAAAISGAHPGDATASQLAVCDFDADGFPDLALSASKSILVYKGPLP
jgi:MYXO-CTERM domain-containing protein